MFFTIIFFDIVLITPAQLSQVRRRRNFLNFRAIFGQKIGKNDKNLKLFFKIFWHRPPFSQKISENKIRQRWSKYPPCFFKILQTRGGITSAIHRHPHRKKFSCHHHRHRKKSCLITITVTCLLYTSPSPRD